MKPAVSQDFTRSNKHQGNKKKCVFSYMINLQSKFNTFVQTAQDILFLSETA
nr:MAG TPA: hypothetical protein [Caudoviricetes sp.]